ncbi:MAG: ribonuclease III [Planctomycetales bacterium]
MPNPPELALSTEMIARCEAMLRYEFRDKQLLQVCLTHASGARHRLVSNERLEFLGDAVLGMVVCEMLYRRFPEATEGDLTRIKSILVSRQTCARISLAMGCHEFLLVGKGLSTNESVPSSVVAAVLESLIAGVYMDGGLEAARRLIEEVMTTELELTIQHEQGKNYKSQLQQVAQRQFGETPLYRLLDEKGPDHSKCFKIAAMIGSLSYPAAWGPTKKEAEQRAAQNALSELQGREIPYAGD